MCKKHVIFDSLYRKSPYRKPVEAFVRGDFDVTQRTEQIRELWPQYLLGWPFKDSCEPWFKKTIFTAMLVKENLSHTCGKFFLLSYA